MNDLQPNSDPFVFLSPQLWRLIGAQLTNPVDRQHLCEVFPSLAPLLLEPSPAEVHLAEIVPLLGDLLASPQKRKCRHRGLDGWTYLSNKNLLKLRLVSKEMDLAVRDYFQRTTHQKAPFIDVRNTTEKLITVDFVCSLTDNRPRLPLPPVDKLRPKQLREWLARASLTHPPNGAAGPNPILSQAVKLHWNPGSYMTASTNLLRAYGYHIHHLSIRLPNKKIHLQEVFSDLAQWLGHLPNLTHLQLFCEGLHRYAVDPNQPIWEQPFPDEEIAYLDAHPLPELPHLHTLEMNWLPYPLQNAVLQNYHYVRELKIEVDGWAGELCRQIELENLETLTLPEISTLGRLDTLRHLLTPSSHRISTLSVEFSMGKEVDLTITHAVQFLNDLFGSSNTLTELFLVLWLERRDPNSFGSIRDSRVNLPNVQEVKLRINNYFSPDLLLPMRDSLSKLVVELFLDQVPRPRSREDGHTQLNGWPGKKMLKSNIWTSYPKLSFFRLESRSGFGWTYVRRASVPLFVEPGGKEVSE